MFDRGETALEGNYILFQDEDWVKYIWVCSNSTVQTQYLATQGPRFKILTSNSDIKLWIKWCVHHSSQVFTIFYNSAVFPNSDSAKLVQMMRVAVADVGTNSTHLLIAETRRDGFRVLDALKDRTRLGECLDSSGNISEEGFARLARSLGRFRELAASLGVQELRTYATSAMRGAPNGEAIAQRLQAEVGVYPVIISGEREGELTYLGASGSVHFGPDNLLLDLGGGSLELVRGDPNRAETVLSLPLGSVRLNRQFLGHTLESKAPKSKDLKALREYIRHMLAPLLEPYVLNQNIQDTQNIQNIQTTQVFGSSGTFETLASVLAAKSGALDVGINGLSFTVAALGELLEELCQMSTVRRSKVQGLDLKRADIIVAGAMVLHTTLELLGAKQFTVSAGALREGMLHEYLLEQQRWTQGLPARQRSVLGMAERFGANLAHARQVTLLCQNLYDRLQALELLPKVDSSDPEDTPRSLLSAAATLHDIGLLIGQSSHHKHSSYLIRNGGLLGFDPTQIDLVAQIARYHRKSTPKPSHLEFAALPAATQKRVAQLSAILRLADSLDRSHTQQAQIVDLCRQEKGLLLRVRGVHSLELEGIAQKGDLWEQVFGSLEVEVI